MNKAENLSSWIRETVVKNQLPAKSFESPKDIESFKKLWAEKDELNDLNEFDRLVKDAATGKLIWHYSIRIEEKKRTTLWIYNSNGVLAALSKAMSPKYKMRDPALFLRLIEETN